MRGFQCHYYYLSHDNNLYKNYNTACWAGLKHHNCYKVEYKEYYDENIYNKEYIYIDQYIEPEVSDKDRQRLVKLINNITMCKIVKVKGKFYIKYKLLKTYDQNLILLNFIRTLWYQPANFNIKQFFEDIHKKYTKDTLEFLTECLRDNVIVNNNSYSYGDHSSIYLNIKPKTTEQLFNYQGTSTKGFLTQ